MPAAQNGRARSSRSCRQNVFGVNGACHIQLHYTSAMHTSFGYSVLRHLHQGRGTKVTPQQENQRTTFAIEIKLCRKSGARKSAQVGTPSALNSRAVLHWSMEILWYMTRQQFSAAQTRFQDQFSATCTRTRTQGAIESVTSCTTVATSTHTHRNHESKVW